MLFKKRSYITIINLNRLRLEIKELKLKQKEYEELEERIEAIRLEDDLKLVVEAGLELKRLERRLNPEGIHTSLDPKGINASLEEKRLEQKI